MQIPGARTAPHSTLPDAIMQGDEDHGMNIKGHGLAPQFGAI